MKFTKTAVAVAIAGIAATPMIASAETTLSGIVEIGLFGDDRDDDPQTTDDEEGAIRVSNGDIFAGITTSHELNNGLTGYGGLRYDLDVLSNSTDEDTGLKNWGGADNVHAGIKGGFGDVRIGEIPLTVEYGQMANDLHDIGSEISGGLSYTGSFGGATVGLNFSPANNQDAIGAGIKFSAGGFTIGLGAEDRDELMNYSVGASYALGGLSLAAHMGNVENGGNADDSQIVAAQAKYGVGDLSLGLTFSTMDNTADFETKIRFDAGYAMGGGTTLSTRVTSNTDGGGVSGADLLEYRVLLSKSF